MAKKDENTLAQVIDMVRRAWWHRPGYEPIGQVLDTFDALGYETRQGLKPVLSHKHRIPGGWHLVFTLPPGIASKDVEKQLYHFQEQTGGQIDLTTRGPKVHMDITTAELPDKVPYEWEDDKSICLPLVIGHTGTGLLTVDLADIPHVLIAGATGHGKSNELHVIATSLIIHGVATAIIDLKRLEYSYLKNHAVVANTAPMAADLLAFLNRELDRRLEVLEAAGCVKLQEYGGTDIPWCVLIVDELGELRDKDAQEDFLRLVRLSRAAGINVIAATQRPSHTLYKGFTDARSMFLGRLCFPMGDQADSEMILGNDAAYRLPRIKGRAVWQWQKQTMVQTMYLPVSQARRLIKGLPRGVEIYEQRPERLLPR